VLASGGEVLRFVGDAVLAIFPVSPARWSAAQACEVAVAAANEAARIEGLCKTLGGSLLVSDAVARHLEGEWRSLGEHALRGVGEPIELFTAPELSRSLGVNAMANKTRVAAKPALLAGGNPQIAKADGDAPVQAYIAAMPGWKRDVGRRLDALLVRNVPNVRKAVRWNSPFYGIEGQGWFLNFQCFTKYVKVAFFRGTSLRPVPPGESKHTDVRYLDIHEDDRLDQAQMATWIRQAAATPGWGKA
jgi:hypothetical protein